MGLSDIRKSINEDAEANARQQLDAARKQAQKITEDAKLKAASIQKAAADKAKLVRASLLREAEAELSVEAGNMLASAREEVVSQYIYAIKKKVSAEISKSHMREISEKAIRSFAGISKKEDAVAEGSSKVLDIAKGFGKKIVNKDINGIVLYTSDKKIRLSADINEITEDATDVIKSAISSSLFGE